MAFLRIQKRTAGEIEIFCKEDFFWATEILCKLKKVPYDQLSLLREFFPPYTISSLICAARLFGLRILKVHRPSCRISAKTLPSLAIALISHPEIKSEQEVGVLGIDLIIQSGAGKIAYISRRGSQIQTVRCDDYARRYTGCLMLIADGCEENIDFNGSRINRFGFDELVSDLLRDDTKIKKSAY